LFANVISSNLLETIGVFNSPIFIIFKGIFTAKERAVAANALDMF